MIQMKSCKNDKTVLHMIDTTGPGGAETVFIQLADLLRSKGYRSLVVIRGPGWVKDELERRGLHPIVLDAKGSFAAGFLIQLIRLAKQEKVELIQSHLLGSNVYAAMLGACIRRPVVATYHGMVDVNPDERFRFLKHRAMQMGISRYVAVSHSLAEQIRQKDLLDPAKTRIIYNGVDSSRYARDPECDDLRKKLGLSSQDVLVGSLGNVRPAKAYDVLIDAARIVGKARANIHFVIAGHKRPALMEKLQEQMKAKGVEAKVHFIGFVDDSARFLSQLDFFLLSSRSEGFSIATIEAMMTGLPVVVTRCGGPEEIVDHGRTGWIAEAENPQSLAEGLLQLLDHPGLAAQIATEGEMHARRTFGVEAMVNQYLRVYQALEPHSAGIQLAPGGQK
ncbi:glycosyltransferase family 4 protein [Proteobacteria bacterium 005FR1]|nr:glycosyltransferase family 4 protein [Proteobacteria bacterium 005FR1]